MVSFENFVKSLPPSISELKVKPIFCFPIKIRDDPTASNKYFEVKPALPSQDTSNFYNTMGEIPFQQEINEIRFK